VLVVDQFNRLVLTDKTHNIAWHIPGVHGFCNRPPGARYHCFE
jgi:hypothetical protein